MVKREYILGTNRLFSVIIIFVKRNILLYDLKELKKKLNFIFNNYINGL